MNCPKCGERTTVLETTDHGTHVERRRGHRGSDCVYQFRTVEAGQGWDVQSQLDTVVVTLTDLKLVFNTLFFIQERLRLLIDTEKAPDTDTLYELLGQIRDRLPQTETKADR